MVRIKFAHCPLSWLRCVTQIWLLLALMLWLGLPFDIPTSSMVSCLISDDLTIFPTQVPPETSTHASAAWASIFFCLGRKSHCSWSASFFNTPRHSIRNCYYMLLCFNPFTWFCSSSVSCLILDGTNQICPLPPVLA